MIRTEEWNFVSIQFHWVKWIISSFTYSNCLLRRVHFLSQWWCKQAKIVIIVSTSVIPAFLKRFHKSIDITVWVAISVNGLLSYDISDSTMSGNRYAQVWSQNVFPHFIVPEINEAILQQDGASTHCAKSVK